VIDYSERHEANAAYMPTPEKIAEECAEEPRVNPMGFEPIESGTIQEGDLIYDGGEGRWREIPMLVGQPIKAGRYAVCRPIKSFVIPGTPQ
jgi:hypothetical protein